jgi:hypothetical protein
MARTLSDTENNSGKKPEALDPLSELSDFLYVCNTANQAHTHTRTTKAIAEFAGRTISKNMKILIKRSQEATFTKPVLQTSGAGTSSDPGKVSTRAEIETYKIEQTQYLRDIREYQKEKEKMFAIIFNQCTPEVKNRLENSADFDTMEDKDDVIALVSKLEDMAYSVTGDENAYWTLQRSLRRLAGVQQGNNGDSLIKYMERFMCYTKAVESFTGPLVPTKIDADNTSISDDSKRDKLLAALFLGGADQLRFKPLKASLHNAFIEGSDNYPTTVSKAVELLTNYNGQNSHEPTGAAEGNSFAQMPKNPCPKCRRRHPYGPCSTSDDGSRGSNSSQGSKNSRTRRGQAHAQVIPEDLESDDDDSSYNSHL